MTLPATLSLPTDRASAARPARAFLLALGVALASGVALAAWSATVSEAPPAPGPGFMLPRGPLLDRLLDEAQASPTQRAQAHQIFEAADNVLRQDHGAERADREQLARLFERTSVDPAAVEALRSRIEQRHDLDSRRTTQALLDVSMVLNPGQRQVIAARLAGGPHPFGGFRPPQAASSAF